MLYIYYGARARAGGTCLVAVLHAASVIGCVWGVCIGCRPLHNASHTRRTHPTPDDASRMCNTATRHVPPALALAPHRHSP